MHPVLSWSIILVSLTATYLYLYGLPRHVLALLSSSASGSDASGKKLKQHRKKVRVSQDPSAKTERQTPSSGVTTNLSRTLNADAVKSPKPAAQANGVRSAKGTAQQLHKPVQDEHEAEDPVKNVMMGYEVWTEYKAAS